MKENVHSVFIYRFISAVSHFPFPFLRSWFYQFPASSYEGKCLFFHLPFPISHFFVPGFTSSHCYSLGEPEGDSSAVGIVISEQCMAYNCTVQAESNAALVSVWLPVEGLAYVPQELRITVLVPNSNTVGGI